jgi:MYXO-CTERM domain-containing protein
MSAAAGGSGILAGTINGCVFATTANTLAGTTDVDGCSSTAAAVPEPGSLALASLGSLLALVAWRRSVTMTKSRRCA